jgi:hypothetical protein
MISTMLTLVPRTPEEDRLATQDRVIRADGSISIVPRTDLAAAKALLAAQHAAERRVEARTAHRSSRQRPARDHDERLSLP